MKALLERAETLARIAQKRRIEELAQAWNEAGTFVTTGPAEVVIEARRLERRRLTDPGLRFVGLGR